MNFKKLDIAGKMTRAAGLTGGAIAATAVNNKLVPMVLKNADAKTTNLVTFGLGLFGPDVMAMVTKKKKSAKPGIVDAVFDGMIAASGVNLVNAFMPGMLDKISGVGMPLMLEEEYINGYAPDVFDTHVGVPYAGEMDYDALDADVAEYVD
ncbi:MAG: hypothetical protein AAF206_17355 [Bacteroidota bacterium]